MAEKYNVLSAQIALAGMDRARLAKTVGIHYNTLCRKMRGENSFTLEYLENPALHEALG